MNCAKCGHGNPADARFCGQCGARLVAACAGCGAANPPGNRFCGACGAPLGTPAPQREAPSPTPPRHLAERILQSRHALEGERKQVTVLFADMKGSMELLADRDPEEARKLLDPVLERMMQAVHHYEGTVNQVMGDGIMALFGAPLAHEDHAVRACYAALRMQEGVRRYTESLRASHGIEIQIRVGLNSGEVVVRSIGSDLRMDYSAVGQTTHLAARMEQLATPGTIRLTADTLNLAEGFVAVKPIGPVPVKGLPQPVEVYELTGAGVARTRLQVARSRGLSRFVGRDAEMEQLRRAAEQSRAGHGQVVAVMGEPGVGKSRLYYEFLQSHHAHEFLVLESGSVSYGKATPFLPLADLLRSYFRIEARDDVRGIRVKVTGGLLTLDEALKDAVPVALWLLDALPEDSSFLALEPAERRRQTLAAVKRILLREVASHPLILVFEDLHWIDAETQAFLDGFIESVPAARVLLAVNFRPEYRHGWASKTYYRQLRVDPLPPESAQDLLANLLGSDSSVESLKPILIARTEGRPLFLEESVRMLVETGALAGERGAYRLVRGPDTLQVPATVQAILASRIDRLDPEDKRLLAIGQRGEDSVHLLEGHHCIWSTSLLTGRLTQACDHAVQGLRIYDPGVHHSRGLMYGGHDPGVCARFVSAWMLWDLGFSDQALKRMQEAEALARELSHGNTLGAATIFAAYLYFFRGDTETAFEKVQALEELARSFGLAPFVSISRVLAGRIAVQRGRRADGLVMATGPFPTLRGWRFALAVPTLAEAYAEAKEPAKGLEVLAEGIAAAERDGIGFRLSESYRLYGELVAQISGAAEPQAMAHVRRAVKLAREQQAKSLELRAAMSLARLLTASGRKEEVRAELDRAYGWCREGFDTTDLKSARALLESLG